MNSKQADMLSFPSLMLQLGQVIDHLELLAEKPDALLEWGTETGELFEDEAERLNDLSAQIAAAHRTITPSPLLAGKDDARLKLVAGSN